MTAVPLLVRPLRAEDEPDLLAINRAGTPGVSLLTGAELAESIGLAARFLVAEAEARVIAACPTQHWAIFCPKPKLRRRHGYRATDFARRRITRGR